MEGAEPLPRHSPTVLPKLTTALSLITKRAQHSKNTQKRFFRQAERGRETPPAPLFYGRRPFTPGQSQPQSFGGKNSFTGKRIFLNSSQGSSAEAETHSFSGMQKS